MERRVVLTTWVRHIRLRPILAAGTLALAVLMAAGNASASSVGITSFTDPIIEPNGISDGTQDFDVGWSFTVNQPIIVESLGYNYFGVPLNNSHEVGIWDSSGNLVASAVVDNTSSAVNGYLYTSLNSPVTLVSGTYLIAGTTIGTNDSWIYEAQNITTDPSITLDQAWYYGGAEGGQLIEPTDECETCSGGSAAQYLAVNFSDDPAPEPSTLALIGLGFIGLRMLRRRKSN